MKTNKYDLLYVYNIVSNNKSYYLPNLDDFLKLLITFFKEHKIYKVSLIVYEFKDFLKTKIGLSTSEILINKLTAEYKKLKQELKEALTFFMFKHFPELWFNLK